MSSFDPGTAIRQASPELAAFLNRVREAVNGRLWVVGGFVRDLLLGREPVDLDLSVESDPKAAAEALASYLRGHPFRLDEERGAYRVTLPDTAPLQTIDVSPLRSAGGIESDLRERDFTLNALAFELGDQGPGALIDPVGGEADARAGLVRMVSPETLASDPLRLLRAARLAIEFGFEVEPATSAEVQSLAPRLTEAAGERRRDELVRILESSRAAEGMRLLDALGLFAVLFPEFEPARGCEQPGRFHYYDVFEHCIEALRLADLLLSRDAPRDGSAMRDAFWQSLSVFPLRAYLDGRVGGQSRLVLTKLAALLHDIAKPQTMTREPDGRIRFFGHSEQGAAIAKAICRRLRLGNKETAFVSKLVEEHLRPAQLSQSGLPTDRAIFRFFRDLGDAAPACLVLSLLDAAAAAGPRLQPSRWEGHLAYIRYVLERGTTQTETLGGRHFVSGDTLIRALEMTPGPEVGRLLSAIDEAGATGRVTTEEEAIQLATKLREEWSRQAPTEVA